MRILPLLCFVFPLSLSAQGVVTPGLVDRTNRPDGSPPIATPDTRGGIPLDGEMDLATPSPGDSDLGLQMILKRQERARIFWAMVNAGVFATDNAARLPDNAQDDVYFSSLIGLGAQPALGNNWFLNVALTQEFYRYDKFDVLDFESSEAGVGLIKVFADFHDVVAGIRYGYRRLTDGDFGEETYMRHGPSLTLQKVFVLDRKNSFYLAGTADFDVAADPDVLERFEYSAQAGYDFRLTHTTKLSLFYRFGWRDYQNAPIDEANHIVGAAATWRPNDWAQLELSATWSDNNSESDLLDYQAGSAGIAGNLRVQF